MSKVILFVCDALRDDIAAQHMGYLEHLVEAKKATRWTVIGELPSMSRPMYETLHTGVTSSVHGVVNNSVARTSIMPNVFKLAVEAGKTTAAAAYYFFSELYNRAPYDIVRDFQTDDESLPIQHGRFYRSDEFPDLELFALGAMLMTRFTPDYLLIHPGGLDLIGEREGGDSQAYRKQVIYHDDKISSMLPKAHALGYTVLVTGDHGISDSAAVGVGGVHGGPLAQARRVPLYFLPPDMTGCGRIEEPVSQLSVAPTVLSLLGLAQPDTMTAPVLSAR